MGFGNVDKTIALKRRSRNNNAVPQESAPESALTSSKLPDLRRTPGGPFASAFRNKNKPQSAPGQRAIQTSPHKCELMRQVSVLGMEDPAHKLEPKEIDIDDGELSLADVFSVCSDPTDASESKDIDKQRLHSSLQDDLLMCGVVLHRSPRKSKRRSTPLFQRSGTDPAAVAIVNNNGSCASLDLEDVLKGDNTPVTLGCSTSMVSPYASRQNFHDSMSSTDSNTIVMQAALYELKRNQQVTSLMQEALESTVVGDEVVSEPLNAAEAEVTIRPNETRNVNGERTLPSIDDVFSQERKRSSPGKVRNSGDITISEPLSSRKTPIRSTPRRSGSKHGNSTGVLTARLNASAISIECPVPYTADDDNDDEEANANELLPEPASLPIKSPHKKKLQLTNSQAARFNASMSFDISRATGNVTTSMEHSAMEQQAAMIAFTRRAPRPSRSSDGIYSLRPPDNTRVKPLVARRRPTMA
jgi:hypothetical protein